MHGQGHVGRINYPGRPLGHGLDGFQLVIDLVKLSPPDAYQVFVDLAGYEQDRRGRGVGGAHASGGVQQAGTRDNQRGAYSSARLRVAEGHICGGLFVAGRDKSDPRLVVQRVHRVI